MQSKRETDIIFFSGQSNMQGQTEGCPELNPEIEGALEYRYLTDSLIPLKHPVGEDIGEGGLLLGAHAGGGSLIPYFCDEYVRATGRQAVAVQVARGNTAIAEWGADTERFAALLKKCLSAIERVKREYEIGRIFFVWLQGESDAIKCTAPEEYKSRLIELKNRVKSALGVERMGVIKVGYFYCTSQWHRNISTTEEKRASDERIMSAQEDAVAEDRDFVMLSRMLPELSLNNDYINPEASGHYTNAGMELVGRDAGRALGELANRAANA